jgi:hypothetical protein
MTSIGPRGLLQHLWSHATAISEVLFWASGILLLALVQLFDYSSVPSLGLSFSTYIKGRGE